MNERVADALMNAGIDPDKQDPYRLARAAILAMREPTEAMVDAAFGAKPLPPMRADREHYRRGLIAAMDAALKQEGGS
jgi:hypothetical protein